ncbi:MAG TPA: glycosyltransferase [Tepidisphaeraceae bacterium]|jgi:glycosyltransferase involved in cell wall biosynthesis
MRILHFIEDLNPARGGPQAVAERLGAAQALAGHEVTVLSYSDPDAKAAIDASLRQIPGWPQVRVRLLAPKTRREAWLAPDIRATVRELIPHLDVLHFHGVWELQFAFMASIARAARVPYVITPHGMLDPWGLSQKRLKKKTAMTLFVRRTLNGAAFLHLLNPIEKQSLAALRLKSPVEVVANGVFLDEIDRPIATAPPGGRYVLFMGRLHYKKGVDVLAEAFALVAARVADVRLVVAGPDDGALDDLNRRVAAHGLQGRVDVAGPVYGEQKWSLLRGAACFCLPSRMEGFSIAITEALASRVPAVISQECNFPEAGAAGAASVVRLTAADVAGGITRVLDDEPAARAMGERGRALVEARYTWPAVARQMVEAYGRHPAR